MKTSSYFDFFSYHQSPFPSSNSSSLPLSEEKKPRERSRDYDLVNPSDIQVGIETEEPSDILGNSTPDNASQKNRVPRPNAVIIVDPISTGAMLSYYFYQRNFEIIAVYSRSYSDDILQLVPEKVKEGGFKFVERLVYCKEGGEESLQEIVDALKEFGRNKYNIYQVLVGCEPGVELFDLLTGRVGLNLDPKTINDFDLSKARRHKYIMGECIRGADCRAVKQFNSKSWEEAYTYIVANFCNQNQNINKNEINKICQGTTASNEEKGIENDSTSNTTTATTINNNSNNNDNDDLYRQSFKVVLKPVDSAGADGVYFVRNLAEAKVAFEKIMSSKTIFNTANTEVLIQEYLQGVEYVIDSFSHRGTHKVTAFWKYDKRRVNNAQFVYFGLRLLDCENFTIDNSSLPPKNNATIATSQPTTRAGDKIKTLDMIDCIVQYTHQCLDALGIQNGPSHAEVIWLENENQPCLVEVGARSHGGEGTFMELTEKAIGYNQITLSHDIIFDRKRKEEGEEQEKEKAKLTTNNDSANSDNNDKIEQGEDSTLCSNYASIPRFPRRLKQYAIDVCMVSYEEGIFEGFVPESLEAIKHLPSFHSMEIYIKAGQKLNKTIDLITSPACIQLLHDNLEIIEKDYETIHRLETEIGTLYRLNKMKCTNDSLDIDTIKHESKDKSIDIENEQKKKIDFMTTVTNQQQQEHEKQQKKVQRVHRGGEVHELQKEQYERKVSYEDEEYRN